MTYKHLKTHLDTLIQSHSDQITLTSQAKSKYELSELNSGEDKFNQVFNNFYRSLEATLDHEPNYHWLPPYANQSWEELFPNLNNTHFGLKTNQERLDKDIYDKLWEIYEDWQTSLQEEQQTKKAHKLAHLMSDEGLLGQFMMEAIINMNYEVIKRGNYDTKLETWLTEYQSLSNEKQEDLAEAEKKVKEVLKWIRNHEKNTTEKQSWLPNWPWGKIAWYGGGGLIICLVLSYLWKKFRE